MSDMTTRFYGMGMAGTVMWLVQPEPVQRVEHIVGPRREALAARDAAQPERDRRVERDHGVPPAGGYEERGARLQRHLEAPRLGELRVLRLTTARGRVEARAV